MRNIAQDKAGCRCSLPQSDSFSVGRGRGGGRREEHVREEGGGERGGGREEGERGGKNEEMMQESITGIPTYNFKCYCIQYSYTVQHVHSPWMSGRKLVYWSGSADRMANAILFTTRAVFRPSCTECYNSRVCACLHIELTVSLFIRCTMRCKTWAQPAELPR